MNENSRIKVSQLPGQFSHALSQNISHTIMPCYAPPPTLSVTFVSLSLSPASHLPLATGGRKKKP